MVISSTIIINGTRSQLLEFLKITESDLLTHPDVFVLESAEDSIGIDLVREFQSRLKNRPIGGKYKTAVIMEGEKLTVEAQNALLKTLEEPPPDTHIAIWAKSQEYFLETVISRCQIIEFPRPPLTIDNRQELLSTISKLRFAKVGERFKIAAEFAKNRTNAQNTLDSLLGIIHENPDLLSPPQIKKIFQAKKMLAANTNVRLTMENLFLNW